MLGLEKAETVAEWIAAESGRPMLRILEQLLALGTKRLDPLEDGVHVFHVKVEMHGTPVTLVSATVSRIR
jgi:hypothetical protein